MEAQILRWPRASTASMVGFGNAVLAIEECVTAFSEACCRAEAYTEDLPLFTELGDGATPEEFSLAAGFAQTYVGIYAEQLPDSTTYIENSLADLEQQS